MAKKSSRSLKPRREPVRPKLAAHLDAFARRLTQATVGNKRGAILLRLEGPEGGDYRFPCGPEAGALSGGQRSDQLLEVTAGAARVRAILEGKKNARQEFLAGGMRVRGDIQFAIDLAYELGFIRERF